MKNIKQVFFTLSIMLLMPPVMANIAILGNPTNGKCAFNANAELLLCSNKDISSDDAVVSLTQSSYTVGSSGVLQPQILRFGNMAKQVSVKVLVNDGIAVRKVDFNTSSQQIITWTANDTEAKNIDVIKGFGSESQGKNFTIQLSNVENAVIAQAVTNVLIAESSAPFVAFEIETNCAGVERYVLDEHMMTCDITTPQPVEPESSPTTGGAQKISFKDTTYRSTDNTKAVITLLRSGDVSSRIEVKIAVIPNSVAIQSTANIHDYSIENEIIVWEANDRADKSFFVNLISNPGDSSTETLNFRIILPSGVSSNLDLTSLVISDSPISPTNPATAITPIVAPTPTPVVLPSTPTPPVTNPNPSIPSAAGKCGNAIIKTNNNLDAAQQTEIRDTAFNFGEQYVLPFHTSDAKEFFQIEYGEYVTAIPGRTISVSKTPCDYDLNSAAYVSRGTASSGVLSANMGANSQLEANSLYHINIANVDRFNEPTVESTCAAGVQCGIVIKFSKQASP